jgi:hypothetical protein
MVHGCSDFCKCKKFSTYYDLLLLLNSISVIIDLFLYMPAARARFKGAFGSGQMSTKPNIMARLSAPILLSAAHTRSRCRHSSARVSRSTSLSSPVRARKESNYFIANACTCPTTLKRKSHLCIPFLGIGRPQSQFPHSCVCERFMYSQDRSTYFLQQNRQRKLGLWPRNSFLGIIYFEFLVLVLCSAVSLSNSFPLRHVICQSVISVFICKVLVKRKDRRENSNTNHSTNLMVAKFYLSVLPLYMNSLSLPKCAPTIHTVYMNSLSLYRSVLPLCMNSSLSPPPPPLSLSTYLCGPT